MSNRRPVIGKLINPGCRLATTSPASLEFKVLSPTGVINRNMGGIGLGIVAALENISAKKGSCSFSCRNRMRSDAIPVTRSRTDGGPGKIDKVCSLDEDCNIMTSNKPNKSHRGKNSIFIISPARFDDDGMRVPQPAGFLNSCHLCNKRLHGKDIYMYRGEKAFCSPECRSRQIAMDERPEKCCSQASSSRVITTRGATGIFAV